MLFNFLWTLETIHLAIKWCFGEGLGSVVPAVGFGQWRMGSPFGHADSDHAVVFVLFKAA